MYMLVMMTYGKCHHINKFTPYKKKFHFLNNIPVKNIFQKVVSSVTNCVIVPKT